MKDIKVRDKTFRVDETTNPHFWGRLAEGRWEPHTFSVFDQFIDPNRNYLDIGGWIGPTVLYGAQVAKHAYVIEADPVATKSLRRNISLNDFQDKITLFAGAISDNTGTVKIGSRKHFGDSMTSVFWADSGKGSHSVNSFTLDHLIEEEGVEDVAFIKMDIEGGETKVIPSLATFIQDQKPVLWLSLHYFWYPNPAKDIKGIIDVVDMFENVYDREGKPADLAAILRGEGLHNKNAPNADLLCTFGEWPQQPQDSLE